MSLFRKTIGRWMDWNDRFRGDLVATPEECEANRERLIGAAVELRLPSAALLVDGWRDSLVADMMARDWFTQGLLRAERRKRLSDEAFDAYSESINRNREMPLLSLDAP